MQAWRKVIVWLVLLWLPVQGYAAGFMPFACHKHEVETFESFHDHHGHHHDTHAHHAHHDADAGSIHGLACDDCSLCQLCAAPALPAVSLDGGAVMRDDLSAVTVARFASFIPALPPRPPSTLLV